MICQLELNTDGLWQCTREKCGWLYKLRSDKPPKRNCDVTLHDELEKNLPTIPQDQPEIRDHVRSILAADSGPSLPAKAKHYAGSVIRWCAAGCPVRSKELQEACRLTCQGCPSGQFDPKKEACKVCGCSVKKSRFALRDKVAMATEVCHKGHWPAA
jgi:hypothetical protein